MFSKSKPGGSDERDFLYNNYGWNFPLSTQSLDSLQQENPKLRRKQFRQTTEKKPFTIRHSKHVPYIVLEYKETEDANENEDVSSKSIAIVSQIDTDHNDEGKDLIQIERGEIFIDLMAEFKTFC